MMTESERRFEAGERQEMEYVERQRMGRFAEATYPELTQMQAMGYVLRNLAPAYEYQSVEVYRKPIPAMPTTAELLRAAGRILEALPFTVSRDGEEWCVLVGPNLQEGVAGFHKELSEAVVLCLIALGCKGAWAIPQAGRKP